MCGAPMPGESDGVACDDCLKIARPWDRGAAALLYAGNARKLVLALKHGDRQDLARPAAEWLRSAAGDMLHSNSILIPVPLHRWRLAKRRYNQSALLANRLAKLAQLPVVPDALIRARRTPTQDGRSVEDRFDNLQDAIRPNPKRATSLAGRDVVLIDDVMTSGATFAAATEALRAAGAANVCVLALARVVKDA